MEAHTSKSISRQTSGELLPTSQQATPAQSVSRHGFQMRNKRLPATGTGGVWECIDFPTVSCQSLQNAQFYPDDFDGILAKAPGIDWLHIVASKGILARRIGWPDLTFAPYVRSEELMAIVPKQIELLDPLDGVEDVYNDYTWTPHNFSIKDMDFAIKLNPRGVNAAEGDLEKFYTKGGKIISYHDQADQTVTPKLSAEYYAKVQANLNATLDDMQSFYRLFFVPGMYHCSGCPGTFDIGQVYPLKKGRLNAKENVLLALTKWVEEDQEPETMAGAKFGNSEAQAKLQHKEFLEYCPYPYESKWDGSGKTNEADSWR
ncbi:feruloyl esterase B-2 [Fusarium sp. NRRL 52700]|nr:feruloyl esterase B-2 [Fusarium sp. NRRL 52700]